MHASPSHGRPSLMPLALAAAAAISLGGYVTLASGAPVTGESPVQQARETADEVWEEGSQTVKEETLAHRPEREQAKLEHEEEVLEGDSQAEAAGSDEASEPGAAAGSGETGETAESSETVERSQATTPSGA